MDVVPVDAIWELATGEDKYTQGKVWVEGQLLREETWW